MSLTSKVMELFNFVELIAIPNTRTHTKKQNNSDKLILTLLKCMSYTPNWYSPDT